MNRLSKKKQAQVVAALVEGASINSTVRMTGISKPTILKLLASLGTACAKYQDETLRNLTCKRVQCDEIWSFCFAKDKNLPEDLKGKFGFGSVWTWTAICADSKLMINWLVGNRDGDTACMFISDLASRLAHRVQLSSDGHKPYRSRSHAGIRGSPNLSWSTSMRPVVQGLLTWSGFDCQMTPTC